MEYSTLPMTLHGLEWALLRGLMYGLVLLLTLWGAGMIVEWVIRVRSRESVPDRPRAEASLELPHLHRARNGINGMEPSNVEVVGATRGR
jgi:hypothetical protein